MVCDRQFVIFTTVDDKGTAKQNEKNKNRSKNKTQNKNRETKQRKEQNKYCAACVRLHLWLSGHTGVLLQRTASVHLDDRSTYFRAGTGCACALYFLSDP